MLAGGIEGRLSNAINAAPGLGKPVSGLERLADVPIYRTDAIVRRAESLQAAPASRAPAARMSGATLASLGLTAGVKVRVRPGHRFGRDWRPSRTTPWRTAPCVFRRGVRSDRVPGRRIR